MPGSIYHVGLTYQIGGVCSLGITCERFTVVENQFTPGVTQAVMV